MPETRPIDPDLIDQLADVILPDEEGSHPVEGAVFRVGLVTAVSTGANDGYVQVDFAGTAWVRYDANMRPPVVGERVYGIVQNGAVVIAGSVNPDSLAFGEFPGTVTAGLSFPAGGPNRVRIGAIGPLTGAAIVFGEDGDTMIHRNAPNSIVTGNILADVLDVDSLASEGPVTGSSFTTAGTLTGGALGVFGSGEIGTTLVVAGNFRAGTGATGTGVPVRLTGENGGPFGVSAAIQFNPDGVGGEGRAEIWYGGGGALSTRDLSTDNLKATTVASTGAITSGAAIIAENTTGGQVRLGNYPLSEVASVLLGPNENAGIKVGEFDNHTSVIGPLVAGTASIETALVQNLDHDGKLGFFGANPTNKISLAAYNFTEQNSAYRASFGEPNARLVDLNALRLSYMNLVGFAKAIEYRLTAYGLI